MHPDGSKFQILIEHLLAALYKQQSTIQTRSSEVMINSDDVICFGQWNLWKQATKLREHEGILM